MDNNKMSMGSFPTMGTSAAHLANVAKPLRGRLVPKGGPTDGRGHQEGTKANRSNVMERQGATLAPVMAHYKQNDPNASLVGRRTHRVPSVQSKSGNFHGEKQRVFNAS